MWKLNIICSNMYRNSIITFVIIILTYERRAFGLHMNESVCFINGQGNKNGMWCITELKLCDNAPAYDMSVNIKQFQSSSYKMCDQQCLNQSTVSLMNHTSEVSVKCNGKSNCSLADISVPSTSYGGILTLTFVCNKTDDLVEADNSTTKNTGNTLLPTSSSVTSTSIPTTNNSPRTTESSIFFTGNNTKTAGTAPFSTGLIDLPGSTGLVVCFSKQETCQPFAFSCTEGIISQISAKVYYDSTAGRKCSDVCVVNHSTSGTVSDMADHCIGASKCSITHDSGVSNGGVIDINFICAVSTNTLNPTASPPTPSIPDSNTKPSTEVTTSNTDLGITSSAQGSSDPYTAIIVVSVVVPIIVVVVVVAVLMNRRGQCNLLLGKFTKGYAKRSPNRTDTHDMSFTADGNLYCDLNRDVNANGCDYCQIATVGKETVLE